LKHHVSADLVLVELVDDDGTPVPPGEEGRVVVTPFYGYATPLIRYDLGDRVEVTPHERTPEEWFPLKTEHCG